MESLKADTFVIFVSSFEFGHSPDKKRQEGFDYQLIFEYFPLCILMTRLLMVG